MKLKDLPKEDRPIEKLQSLGVENLTSTELIAILLHTGFADKTVLSLSQEILQNFQTGNFQPLARFSNVSLEELCCFQGIGKKKAARLLAAIELGKRVHHAELLQDKQKLCSPEAVVRYMQNRIGHLEHEQLWAIYLNVKNEWLDCMSVSKGSLNQTSINKQEICYHALKLKAAHVILVHNHPSGDVQASQADLMVTKQMYRLLKYFDVLLLDHIVVSKNQFYSIRNHHIDCFVEGHLDLV